MTTIEPPEGPALAPPPIESLQVTEPAEVAVEEEMELQLESEGEQNNSQFMADLNNSWEDDTPVERNAGVGRRVLPSRNILPSVTSVTDDDLEPVLPQYVIL